MSQFSFFEIQCVSIIYSMLMSGGDFVSSIIVEPTGPPACMWLIGRRLAVPSSRTLNPSFRAIFSSAATVMQTRRIAVDPQDPNAAN